MYNFNTIANHAMLLKEAKRQEAPLNVITLFSGMGAPEIALDQLGIKYRVIIASDIDNEAIQVYNKLHGKKLAYGDDSFIPNVYDVNSQYDKFSNDEIDLLIAGFPCFTAGTLVLTKDGMKPIEDINKGDLVLTHKNRWKPVIRTMQKEGAKIYQVKGNGFIDILTTAEHPFYAIKDKNSIPEWKEVINLKSNDLVGTPKYTDEGNNIKENKEFLDNYFSKYKEVISGDLSLIYELKVAIVTVYGYIPKIEVYCNEGFENVYKITLENNNDDNFEKDNILWDKLTSIKNLDYTDTVYNLEVADDNSYTANSIIVHNCQAFSTNGKQYGVNSRQIKLLGDNGKVKGKKATVSVKKHLENINGNTATITTKKIDNLPKDMPPGSKVQILPDSDGMLALETLKVINKFKPRVIILENVAAFGQAGVDSEEVPSEFLNESAITPYMARKGNSGFASLSPSKTNKNAGGYLRLLGNILGKIGYSFYPLYLDPTSYTDSSIQRRPRIYIVGIREDINDSVNPEKLDTFDDKIASNFGINSTAESQKKYEMLVKQTVNYIVTSKDSNGYITHNPNILVKDLVSKFGKNRFVSNVDSIFNLLVKDNYLDVNVLKQIKDFDLLVDKLIAEPKIQESIKKIRTESSPVIIDISNKPDTIKQLTDIIKNNIRGYFDDNYIPKSRDEYIAKLDNSEKNNNDKDELGNIVESIENGNITDNVDSADIIKVKETIISHLLSNFLTLAYHKRSINYIPTLLKSQTIANTYGNVCSSSYYIFRDTKGKFAWGYLCPLVLSKLMGMYNKNASGDDEVYQALASTKLKNGKNISLNGIIRRIGNSMSVNVLKKLFKALAEMKAL